MVEACARRGLTVAVAESLTGGALSSALVDVPGASRVLRGAVVAYATDLKAQVLGVREDLLAERGAVDADVAAGMCAGVRTLLGAAVGVSTTGVAGPDPQDGQAPGTVFVAVAADWLGPAGLVRHCDLAGDRAAVRSGAVAAALALLAVAVERAPAEQAPAPGS
ncbi:nicotinamide-nucleotide amidase [Kineococcus xinjiangensis]|uniref:Nicotinamide-nucleotide amidase n=1 Tax=Kineococcus xinjiangensis TaxID=512762 RepID=A0A2S6IW23_9ACTN|nr:nicotinamide-nucleotide amidase [Kineococcus xinjiangensis]